MKNLRNICLALIIPFGVSALAFTASSIIIRPVERDITDIDWNYRDMEGYSMLAGRQPLFASQVYDSKYPLSKGNDLVWKVENPDGKKVGEIQEDRKGQYYFNPLDVGRCTVICSNEKGNVNRSFTALVFAKGAIIANPSTATSGHSISGVFRFGMYDYSRGEDGENLGKVKADASLDIDVIGDAEGTNNLEVTYKSANISSIGFENNRAYIEFNAPGEASFTLKDHVLGDDEVEPLTYTFEVVDGVNIYSYDDLMEATNRSEEGENLVLRTNLGSLSDLYEMDPETGRPLIENGELVPLESPRSDTVLFGDYDPITDTFSFGEDAYSFDTTLDSPFIDRWNDNPEKLKPVHPNYEPYDTTLYAGIHLKGDLYGNGFSIDLHDLTFPYEVETRTDEVGNTTEVVGLRDDNLFRGPLTYFALGDPHISMSPFIASYGQDNCGVLIDTDGVTISDTQIQNCDFGDNFENLRYTGTVLDIEASNVTVEDSVISNGRNTVRAYSAPNLTIENSLLENGYEYLIRVGSNNLAEPGPGKSVTLDIPDSASDMIPDYPSSGASGTLQGFDATRGNDILNSYLTKDASLSDILTLPVGNIISGPYLNTSPEGIADTLRSMQPIYDASYKFLDESGNMTYDTTLNLEDTMLYRSGIASISADQLIDGPYMWGMNPSNFTAVFGLIKQRNPNMVLNPMGEAGLATRLNRTMQPSRVTVSGDTRFYDWKPEGSITLDSIIYANYALLQERVPTLADCGIDDFFPLSSLIDRTAKSRTEEGVEYINIPYIKTGGGINESKIVFDSSIKGMNLDNEADVTRELLLRDFKSMWPETVAYSTMNLIAHSLTTFTGFAPYVYGYADESYPIGVTDVPDISLLMNRGN